MKYIILIYVSVVCVFYSLNSSAAPYLYTFTGPIDYVEADFEFYTTYDFDNDFGTPEDTFQSGETIEYTFLVDFDLAGFCEGPLGTSYSETCTGVEIPDSDAANFFFTDLVHATKLAPGMEEGTTFYYGLSMLSSGYLVSESAVFVSSMNNEPVEDWVAESGAEPGTLVVGADAWSAVNGNGSYGRVNSTLLLTSIKPLNVVDYNGHCGGENKKDRNIKSRKNNRNPNLANDRKRRKERNKDKLLVKKNGMEIFTSVVGTHASAILNREAGLNCEKKQKNRKNKRKSR